MSITLGLKGVTPHIGLNQLANNIEANLKEYFDYAFLTIGGWTDVSVPQSGYWDNDLSLLRQVDDPTYTSGTVWATARKDLVWDTGVVYTDPTGGLHNPTPVGNPIVNGSPNTGFYVDYPNGLIVFNSAQTGTVRLEHAYRYIQTYKYVDANWFHQLQYESYRSDNYNQTGFWSVLAVNRVQLPAVIIKSVPVGTSKGFELGGKTLGVNRQVEFTVLAESPQERNNIVDMLSLQNERKLKIFDVNNVDYPLDYRGMLTGTTTYTGWIESTPYIFNSMRLADSRISELQDVHPNLFLGVVRTNIEILA